MKKCLAFLLILAFSSASYAEPPTELIKGQTAPFTGILFSKDDELKLRDINEEKISLERRLKWTQDDNTLLGSERDLWRTSSENLSKTLVDSQNDSFWKKSAYFALGVLATVGAAYAVKGATR